MTLKGHTEFQMNRNDMCYEFKLMEKQQLTIKKKKKSTDTLSISVHSHTTQMGIFTLLSLTSTGNGLDQDSSLWKSKGSHAIMLGPKCHPWLITSAVLFWLIQETDLEDFTHLMTTFTFFFCCCYFETGVLGQGGLESTGFFQLKCLWYLLTPKLSVTIPSSQGQQF